MSDSTEWINAHFQRQVEQVDDDFEDEWGQQVDPGNIGIALSETVILEGTHDELIAWAERTLSVIRSATT